jgi:putative flippase GtrA/xanthosine utilization system XapX-like protein
MQFIQQIIDALLDEIKASVRGYASKLLRNVVKLLVLSVVAVTFVAVGFIFILIGIVKLLSETMPVWLAWGLVGLVAVLIGGAVLLVVWRQLSSTHKTRPPKMSRGEQTQSSSVSHAPAGGIKQKIMDLDKRYGVFKAAKFGLASGSGFLIAEVILIFGLLLIFRRFSVSGADASSPTLVELNIVAFVVGIGAAFFINERITVNASNQKNEGKKNSVVVRLLKYEGINGIGNAGTILVQLLLLWVFAVSPVVGNIVGAIVTYPITYLVSMRFVWKTKAVGSSPPAKVL